jgi:spermidine synthase
MYRSTHFEQDLRLGCTITWQNATTVFTGKTARGTHIEMVQRPGWGISCYMNGVLQSCEYDEAVYHKALVGASEATGAVCILGGGEGATAREILRSLSVESVDMYEWDCDVVNLFRTSYRIWGRGAWEDKRLRIHYTDVFEFDLGSQRFDMVICDLFEPGAFSDEKWRNLFCNIRQALKPGGVIRCYAGMDHLFGRDNEQVKIRRLLEECGFGDLAANKQYVPSFLGEAVFICGVARLTMPYHKP